MKIAANISTMFTQLPMHERFSAARDAGFDAVEIQFPDEEADRPRLIRAARAGGLPVVLINVPRGGGVRSGLAALPGHEAGFARALEVAAGLAADLGAAKVNVLAGAPPPDQPRAACRQVLIDNLRRAGDRLGRGGLVVLTEPVNPFERPDFFLTSLDAALDVLAAADHPALGLQFDLYHMARTEGDLPAAIARAGARIRHVQFADAPGRGAPGSGRLDFARALAALDRAGYRGVIAAEYLAPMPDAASLRWLDDFRKVLQCPTPPGPT